MKSLKPLFVILLACSGMSAFPQDTGFLKAEHNRIVDGKGTNVILRGVGLGGWMLQEGYMLHINKEGQQYRIKQRIASILGTEQANAFYKSWLSNHTTRSDIDSLHAWGFNSVRLPMHYNLFTLPAEEEPEPGKNTWLPTGFVLTDSLVSWCKANHMYVILDLHAAPGGQGNDLNISDRDPSKPSLWQSEANKQKTISLWRKIAERYAGEPAVAGYDILNEPNWGFEDTLNDRNGLAEQKNLPLKQLMMDITRAIRDVDKNHIIIIEGNGWGNNYNGILGTWDNNMVLSFHKYWNSNDLQSIQHILTIRDQYDVPVWVGESGENSNTWFTEAIRLLETNNIGWCWWPLKKLGNNNPLQIKSNPEYDALANYWNGKTDKLPAADIAYRGLMELAVSTKCEKNIVHRDVIDAMIRQPFSSETLPFKINSISPGSSISAVDYDLGSNGAAYYDKDTANYRSSTGKEGIGNRGRIYRNDGVDIYEDPIQKSNYYVGNVEDGEWLQYSVQITKTKIYHIEMTASADSDKGLVSLYDNGVLVAEKIMIPSTDGLKTQGKITIKNIHLNQGSHRLRVLAVKGGFDFFSLDFY